ncbi:MAG: methionyl-tRNA synthetase [Parcubacteria group bacterium Gr01-1014_24]|nr:MAG: methionyl-tRNA synthetase [Parcubacteria group bacterium Gr01-1014_24]
MTSNEKKPFFITTTIPYVNAEPHIGFALELVQSDAIARYQRLTGKDVFFSTGTDEYGQKIWEASQKEGKDIQDYVDHYAQKFLDLKDILNLSYNNFIRTTSKEHIKAAQEFWRLCDKKGDIYKKIYRGLYCVGCEKFITERDLVNSKCSLHPTQEPEVVEEENYFFRLGNYKKQLLDYLSNEKVIIPEWRRKEAIDFVQDGMEDFSISRDKKRFSWGIPIPGDDTQVMYVWFDALINYISTLGWPASAKATAGKPDEKENLFEKFWQDGETVQTAGKDMVKFQSVMWQGMLMSAGLPTTDRVVYHGFITSEGGIKMSKSLGNVISPGEIVKEYGTDALRYFLLREISPFEDSPFTMERFKDAYNANLANGLGNLVSRIMKMAVSNNVFLEKEPEILPQEDRLGQHLNKYYFNKGVEEVMAYTTYLDAYIQAEEPFKKIKINPDQAKKDIEQLLASLFRVGRMLRPLLPHTSQRIINLVKENKMPETPLFPRKD